MFYWKDDKILVKNKKYYGKYVAMKDFNSMRIIASGKDPEAVFNRAKAKGCDSPVIIFINDKPCIF